jgi:alcohol dehydrogenase
MFDMTFRLDPEIICGIDTINRAGTVCAETGNRALVVTEKALYENKTIDRLIDILKDAGVEAILFDEVPPNAAADTAESAASLAQGGRCSVVIGFGGLKTQAVARTAAIIARGKLSALEFLDGAKPPENWIPYIAIPTMLRDPFFFSPRFLVVDPRDRLVKLVQSPPGLCKALVLDGSLPEPLPAKVACSAAFDGFCAVMEAYCSARASVLSAALLEQAIIFYGKMMGCGGAEQSAGAAGEDEEEDFLADTEIFTESAGPETSPPDPAADTVNAALLLALGCAVSGPGIGTALAYTLDGRFPLNKSCYSSMLLPGILEKLVAARPERLARAALLMGEAAPGDPVSEAANKTVQAVRRCLETLGAPAHLKNYNLVLDRLVPVAETARNLEFVSFSPWTVSTEDAYELLKQAF